jgi:hypothetical protein
LLTHNFSSYIANKEIDIETKRFGEAELPHLCSRHGDLLEQMYCCSLALAALQVSARKQQNQRRSRRDVDWVTRSPLLLAPTSLAPAGEWGDLVELGNG